MNDTEWAFPAYDSSEPDNPIIRTEEQVEREGRLADVHPNPLFPKITAR